MPEAETTKNPSSPPLARGLGKMVAGGLLTSAALRFRDREAFYCAGTGAALHLSPDQRTLQSVRQRLTVSVCARQCLAFLCNNRAELPEIYFALAKLGLSAFR